MKTLKASLIPLIVAVAATLGGCSTTTPSVENAIDSIRSSLNKAGLKDVAADQDRAKGVITLTGHVALGTDKAQAESIAKSFAGTEVVANQIAILPVGGENAARRMNADLDRGIEANLDAILIQERLHKSVKYSVSNLVVTLSGDVISEANRARAARVASTVPNVQQVVNELQVKAQKATSTN